MQAKKQLPPVLGVLYTHNPFYLLSTLFVLYAVKRAFRPELMEYINPWALMASLTGFTLLIAVTAWVVVRYGKVWEDARTMVLVLVLMFLAISVSFDELLNLLAMEAVGLLAFGFGFSVLVTEGILRSLRIRFPAGFRVPFYLMLALFFGYPVWVSPEVTELGVETIRWRIAAFPAIAGGITLLLLFAVRKGAAYVSENGTPWRWPWFPWTVFGFLALAVCGRSYSLTISFDRATGHVLEMNSAFGGYFLVPFAVAVLILLLEIGIVERRAGLQNGVLVAATFLLPLSIPYRMWDPTYREFLTTFVGTLASPVFLTVCCLLAFYAYAWMRRVRAAEAGVVAMLALASVVGPRTLGPSTLTEPTVWPLIVLAVLQIGLAVVRRRSTYAFAAALSAAAVTAVLLWTPEWLMYRRIVPVHIVWLSAIGLGVVCRDAFARFLSAGGAAVLPPVSLFTAYTLRESGMAESVMLAYLAGVTALALLHWYWSRDRWYLAAGLMNVACGSGGISWYGYRQLMARYGSDVIQPLLYGLACFLIAALISAHKAGAFNGFLWRRRQASLNEPQGE